MGFVIDEDFDVKPEIKVELDPGQLRRRLAALAIYPPSPSSSTSGEAAAPGHIPVGSPYASAQPDPGGRLRPSGPSQAPRPTEGIKDEAPGRFQPEHAPGA